MPHGVDFNVDMALQIVIIPHLLSLNAGIFQVEEEIKKLAARNWYGLFAHMPFIPMRGNGQGSEPRKNNPERPRRVIEAGGPRKSTFDTDGISVVSLNDAARGYVSITKAEWLQHLQTPIEGIDQHLPMRLSSNHQCTMPPEIKPTFPDIMHNGAILKHLAVIADEPIYCWADDIFNFFSQLATSPNVWHLTCILLAPLHPLHNMATYMW